MNTNRQPHEIERAIAEAKFIHLKEEELFAYREKKLDTIAMARAKAHLKLCLTCEQRLLVIEESKAAEALGQLGDVHTGEALELLPALHDADTNVRKAAARSLGRLSDTRAVEPLSVALQNEVDNDIRLLIAEALGKIGGARAMEGLLAAQHDTDWRVRETAVRGLGEIGDIRAVEPLLGALGDRDENVRYSAAMALSQIGDARAVEGLLAALHDANWRVRENAARALAEVEDERTVDALVTMLQDPSAYVRLAAVEALDMIGDTRARVGLRMALGDEDQDVQSAVIQALSATEHMRSEPEAENLTLAIVTHLEHPEGEVRSAAVEAIGKLGSAVATPAMLEHLAVCLQDPVGEVRSAAAEAIGKLGSAAATPAILERLAACLQDPEEEVRSAAAEVIGNLGSAAATPAMLERPVEQSPFSSRAIQGIVTWLDNLAYDIQGALQLILLSEAGIHANSLRKNELKKGTTPEGIHWSLSKLVRNDTLILSLSSYDLHLKGIHVELSCNNWREKAEFRWNGMNQVFIDDIEISRKIWSEWQEDADFKIKLISPE